MSCLSRGFLFAVVAWAIAAPVAVADTTMYRSNEAGMLLEPIAKYREDEYTYVMALEREKGLDVQRLLENGKEIRRLETSLSDDGKKTAEREYDAGVLSARRYFDPLGELLWEETYTDGKLAQKVTYEYRGGRVTRSRVTDASGALLYTDTYSLSGAGALRGYTRTFPDGSTSSSSYVAGGLGLGEERLQSGDTVFVTRYDNKARLVDTEKWKTGQLVSRLERVYREDTDQLRSTTETRPVDKTVIQDDYDGGRLSVEKTTVDGKQTEQIDHTWDANGNETLRHRRSADGIEEWRFSYTSDGTLTQEQYFRRGSLEKTTVYTSKTERYEEVYSEGEMVLRVYYQGDAKVKEQVFERGSLVRERSFP